MSAGQGVPPVTTPGAPPQTGGAPMSNQNLNQIVTEFLLKRGYTRTELVFRDESKNINDDGRPVIDESDVYGPRKHLQAFKLLSDWVENSLQIYKFELAKVLWPYFVYAWIDLILEGHTEHAKEFFKEIGPSFEKYHADDLHTFSTISTPEQLKDNRVTSLYMNNRYSIPLNQHITGDLFHFIEREDANGGACIRFILQTYCKLETSTRGPITPYSFEAITRRTEGRDLEDVDAQEGIPGLQIGVTNKDVLDSVSALKLGPLPMEEGLREDVRAELLEEDQRKPPNPGQASLADEFDQRIKREETDDAPSRADLPLPPSRVRDVIMEMQKVRENRDRFKIEGRTGGIGPGLSCCMFTLHNTFQSVSAMDFSKDQKLMAVGTMDSYIRVWSLDGKPLKSKNPEDKDLTINNRKLIGHSGPVYAVSFSDAIDNKMKTVFGVSDKELPDTGPKLLLSGSADGHIRLWSLELWTCLCVYKGHSGPVFRVLWGPHGHYFLSGGHDKTARVWMQDHASAQRLLVGHDTSVSAIAWHPNGMYVFSASDETDKTIRMWSVVTGQCVRVFTGHTDYISALECAPNGKILASADNAGNIFFWDLASGARIKRSRGHGKGGILSMSFGVESTVLVSAGQDCTVRVWDVELPADGQKAVPPPLVPQAGQDLVDGTGAAGGTAGVGTQAGAAAGAGAGPPGQTPSGGANAAGNVGSGGSGTAAGGSGGGGGKKKGKEVMVTPDQLSAWPTKKTPVRKVMMTRMNLVVAGGCFDPDR